MSKIAIIYHSGYGHTQSQAQAVHRGASTLSGTQCELIAVNAEGDISDVQWAFLDATDAIIFGSPTYMGGVSWQFKKFIDASSKRWYGQQWKDKIAAGFTNSGSMNGDKGATISFLITFAMQHSMVWVGTGLMPAAGKDAERHHVNYLGGFSGALAQSPSGSSAEEGAFHDLETASLFGRRIAEVAMRFNNPLCA